jgi:hypothetical protein
LARLIGQQNHRNSGQGDDPIPFRTEEQYVAKQDGRREGEVPFVADEGHDDIEEGVPQSSGD